MGGIMKHLLIIILIIIAGNYGLAESKSNKKIIINKAKIKKIVDHYYDQKLLSSLSVGFLSNSYRDRSSRHDCRPSDSGCLDVACKHLDSFECDEFDEIKKINRACRGNYNGDCLEVMCNLVGKFDCDDIDEIEQLAPACVGNYSGSCIKSTCARLSRFECDDIDEVVEVARYCSGNK